jgi:hypothetical protein
MSDMTQISGAKELQSIVAYSFIIYDYVCDTEFDIWSADLCQNHIVHYLLKIKLYTYRIIKMQ